jgi:hypothetical protein
MFLTMWNKSTENNINITLEIRADHMSDRKKYQQIDKKKQIIQICKIKVQRILQWKKQGMYFKALSCEQLRTYISRL